MPTGANSPPVRTASLIAVAAAVGALQGGCAGALRPGPAPGPARPAAQTRASATTRPADDQRNCAVSPVRRGIRVPAGPVALVTGYGSVWVLEAGSVSQLDPTRGHMLATIHTPGISDYGGVTTGAGSVWATSTDRAGGVMDRIEPSTDRVIARLHPAGSIAGIAVGSHRVWVTQPLQRAGRLLAVDPRTGRLAGPAIKVGPGPGQVVYGIHHVWV
jgi:hypothetical protein